MDMHSKREIRKNKKMNEDKKNLPSTNINWYPGHMAKTKREIGEKLNLIDLVYEIVDARMPLSSRIEEVDNIIVLNDEDGNEVRFEFLDLVELDDEEYVVLLPVAEEGEEEEGEVVILKLEDTDEDSDEESYVGVDDEEILNKVFQIFKEKYKDDFNFVDED